MTNQRKSTLCAELEKNLIPTECVQPLLWAECKTALSASKACDTFDDYIKNFLHLLLTRRYNSYRISFIIDFEFIMKDVLRTLRDSEVPLHKGLI